MSLTTPPRTGRCWAAALLLALLLDPAPAPALEEDLQQPLYLESDSAELLEAESLSVYTGSVFAKQGSMELRGDQVRVHHDAERKPEHIIAVGAPASYKQLVEGEEKPVEGKALRIEYDRAKDEVTFVDQAVLYQGDDTFRSDRIVYDRTKAQVKAGTIAQGKERVQITISSPAER